MIEFNRLNLKKQSQFASGANRLKSLFERIIWQYFALVGSKKTKPNKANVLVPSVTFSVLSAVFYVIPKDA